MDERISQKQCIQVVFLIDTNQFYENRGNKNLLSNAFRAISISVLRLLTYLANREDSDRNKFAWGCQFFKIPLNTHFYSRRSVFRQLTRSAFEDFEKQLEEEIFIGLCGKQKSNQKQEGVEVSPAYSLKYALHDASLEYRWDELVLSSPRKAAKHYKKKSSVAKSLEYDRQTKFVFALLPCPLTSDDLECFCEHRSQITTSFLKRTLINTGKQDSYLFDNLKASLFWLDSRKLWSLNTGLRPNTSNTSVKGGATLSAQERFEKVLTENHDGYNMINETLSLVKGGVISLNCVTNIGGLESSSISQLLHVRETYVGHSCPSTQTGIKHPSPAEGNTVLQKTGSVSQNSTLTVSPALPYSSCLKFYTAQYFSADSNRKLGTTREDEILVLLSDLRENEISSGPKCLLKMQNLWKSPEKRLHGIENPVNTAARQSLNSSPFISLSWYQSDGATATTVDLQNDDIQSETEQIANEGTQTPAATEDQRAFIIAVVPKETLTLDLYQSSHVFSCLGLEIQKETGDNPGPAGSRYSLSKWFEQMLFHLCQKKCLLVLSLFNCFAVLEPLTPVMASIRIIHSRKLMTLEKSLAFDSVPFSVSKPGNEEQRCGEKEDLSTFVGKDVTDVESLQSKFDITRLREKSDISPNAEPKGIGKSTIRCPLELNLHKGTKSLKLFSPNCFEPWYRDLPNRGVSAKFLEQLVSLPEYLVLDESVNLDSTLSQLKQLYKSEQNLPPSQEKEKEHAEESNPTETTKQNVIQGKSKVILRQYKPRTLSILKSIKRVESTGPMRSPRRTKPRQEVSVPFVPDKEFSSEEDLIAYVKEAYTAAISTATSSLSRAQQIVSLTVHFIKEHPHDNTDITITEIVKNFLAKHLFQSNAELIKKYSIPSDALDGKVRRRREAQLQSLLRFELEVAFPTAADQKGQVKVGSEGDEEKREEEEARDVSSEEDTDNESELPEEVQETVDQISQMLSSIPLLGDHEELLTFLDDIVLPSYSDTIPYLVRAVFEELGHPVPDHLMSPASSKPSSVKPPSSYQGIRSWGSTDTVPAASTRSRTWSRHPSLADIGQKRLIIQPKRIKTKPVKKQNEADTEARKARRNLFSDSNKLTRSESVAVMEGISQPRRQSPRKQTERDRQSKVLKTRVVRETPGKRQVSQALLLQARRARKLEERCIGRSLSPTMEVIEESPVKPLVGSAPRLFHRPVKKQLPFYSENKGKSRQDKLQEARHFTARITGSSPVEAADIVKKVQMKKSPARSFLKEVCTPSTLGTLGRLRSGAHNFDLGGSPELKRKSEDEHASKREVSVERVTLSPKESAIKVESKVPSQRTPNKKLCLQDEEETKEELQKDSEGKVRDTPGDLGVEIDQRECLKRKQEQCPPKRTTLRTSLKRMFDGAVKRSPEAETNGEEKGKVVEESQKVMADTIAMSFTSFSGGAVGNVPIQEQGTQEGSSAMIASGTQKDAVDGTPASKKRKIKSESPRLQVLQAVAKSGPASRTPSPRRKAAELLASPEMFKQWPMRKLRSTTPSPKGIFRGQKSKESSESTGKALGANQSPGIQRNENKQSRRHLKTRSKTSLNFTEQRSGDKIGGQIPVPSKNSSNEELERHFSFTSDDDEIEFIKINRSESHDSIGRTLSSDGEVCSKDGEGNSFSPVFSGSQSSVEMASPTTDQSQFKSPASRTRSKTPSKNLKQEGKSASPVFNFVSTPNSSGIKLTLRKQYLSPGKNRGNPANKSSSTTDRDSASTAEDSQSELESTSSHLSSENDEVFSSLCNQASKHKLLSTPPGSSGKMNCKLSTKGLYDLLHSPFAGSPSHRTKPKQTISVSRKKTRKVVIQDQLL